MTTPPEKDRESESRSQFTVPIVPWFGEDFLDQLLRGLCRSPRCLRHCAPILSEAAFKPMGKNRREQVRHIVAKCALDFYNNYHKPIGKLLTAELREFAAKNTLGSELRKELFGFAKELESFRLEDVSAITDKVGQFVARVRIEDCVNELLTQNETGKLTAQEFQRIADKAAIANIARNSPNGEWPDPLPLSDAQPEPMPADILPGPLGDFVRALAAWSETPVELATLAVLGVLSCAVGGKLTVSPEPGYLEPIHLFLCPALESGNRKSSVVTAATQPLMAWEKLQQEIESPRLKRINSRRKTHVAIIERMRKSLRGPDRKIEEQIDELEAKLPTVPVLPELFTGDTTSEKLEMMLAEQAGRAAVISDEGGAFDVMGGRYNAALNLDVYLKGHAGTPLRIQRVGRETVIVDAPSLTVMVSPQPGCLSELRDKAPFRHRGLLARFLYALPPSPIGKRSLDPKPMPENVRLAYDRIIEHLLEWRPAQRTTRSLTPKAYARWKEFQRFVETQMADGGSLSRLRDWGSKLPGAALRIAGILYVAQQEDLSVLSAEIRLPEMQVAVQLCTNLIGHAVAVFGLIGEDPVTTNAKRLLRWLKSQGKREVSKRDCFRAHHPHVFDRVQMMEAPLLILETHHLIRITKRNTGGRPQEVIEINPAVLEAK